MSITLSTVERVLARYGMPRRDHVDQATGLPAQKPRLVRYEPAAPGDLVHIDVKKLGKFFDGGGWRAHGGGSAQDKRASSGRDRAARKGASPGRGYAFLHHVDDDSRVAHPEILTDEKKDIAADFWERANVSFASIGITVTAVTVDKGACYMYMMFAATLGSKTPASRAHTVTGNYRLSTRAITAIGIPAAASSVTDG